MGTLDLALNKLENIKTSDLTTQNVKNWGIVYVAVSRNLVFTFLTQGQKSHYTLKNG